MDSSSHYRVLRDIGFLEGGLAKVSISGGAREEASFTKSIAIESGLG